ncbi:MAG: hypothetical protein Q4A24_02075 [Akkermansia sp.]|nr:hypothetical protein [Akkermansia sp.]
MKLFKAIGSIIRKLRYISSDIKIKGSAKIHSTVVIKNCRIRVDKTSELILEEGVKLKGVKLTLTNGAKVHLKPYAELRQNTNPLKGIYIINNGTFTLGDHSSVRAYRIWIRFGGCLEMGSYINVNDGTEIRADESVKIGSYTGISYNIRIWDTNTHNIYTEAQNEANRRKNWPDMRREESRPKTSPVEIGPYCWIGERSTLLKGTKLGRDVVVGFNTLLSNVKIEDHTIVVQKPELVMFKKNK